MPISYERMLREIIGSMSETFSASEISAKTNDYGRKLSPRKVAGLARAYGLVRKVGTLKNKNGALYAKKML